MIERTDRRRGTPSMRVAWVSLLVASGVGVVGVVPALAADRSPAPAAATSDHDRDRGRGHDRWFRDHGDVRYVWFRVCDGTTGRTTSTTTAPETTTETVATDALAAAVEGAAAETATTTTPRPTTTSGTTTADDDPDDEEYPTFVVVPMPKDEAAVAPQAGRPALLRPHHRCTADDGHHDVGDTTTDTAGPEHGDDDHDAGSDRDHRLTVRVRSTRQAVRRCISADGPAVSSSGHVRGVGYADRRCRGGADRAVHGDGARPPGPRRHCRGPRSGAATRRFVVPPRGDAVPPSARLPRAGGGGAAAPSCRRCGATCSPRARSRSPPRPARTAREARSR